MVYCDSDYKDISFPVDINAVNELFTFNLISIYCFNNIHAENKRFLRSLILQKISLSNKQSLDIWLSRLLLLCYNKTPIFYYYNFFAASAAF